MPGRQTPGDEELADVRLAADGDAEAFERLYRRHVGRIYGLACRTVGSESAGEATQDVFVRAWQKLDTYRGEAAFGSWLYRLALNVMFARQRKAATRRGRFANGELAIERASSPGRPVELVIDFDTAIERLPEGAREVFVLHDVEGFKHREIAEMIGITSGTSKSQLHRARMMLRAHLER
jgi:RNA polymerase sigma-70 factor (ECF subfamily)